MYNVSAGLRRTCTPERVAAGATLEIA